MVQNCIRFWRGLSLSAWEFWNCGKIIPLALKTSGIFMTWREWCCLIAVCVRKDGITVDGHAGYAKVGNDILCAAVFMLAQNFAAPLVWILRCGRAASLVWHEPPIRTNGAPIYSYSALVETKSYLSHGKAFWWIDALNVDCIWIVRNTIHDGICKSALAGLWTGSKRFLASDSVSLSRSHLSLISRTGSVYFFSTLEKSTGISGCREIK